MLWSFGFPNVSTEVFSPLKTSTPNCDDNVTRSLWLHTPKLLHGQKGDESSQGVHFLFRLSTLFISDFNAYTDCVKQMYKTLSVPMKTAWKALRTHEIFATPYTQACRSSF
ncbi:hypothetical protein AV530_005911 [Patagioenas fasciata monilis]|uniref:Uncharacterized protein n=1 Tax=Patagioenas fasciata monilis TaxID=372326 RepID=A0A1V4JN04_PATFA|nr:hypothetical protein AV530_005911 [Patagioenas fasciata monilis]